MSHRGRYVSGAFYLGGVMTGIQNNRGWPFERFKLVFA